jgi:hypothetical protein
MGDSKKIIWLASYPKSGNTWFRIFLSNLFSLKDEPIDINDLQDTTIASNRQLFDDITGLSSADLTLPEIEKLRPHVYEKMAENSESLLYLKIHDAFICTSEKIPLVSEAASLKAVYFIRNPLDVAVSFSHHLAVTVEKSVEIMCNEEYAFCNRTDRLHNQLEQRLFSWSSHVKSWTEQTIIPVKVMRYEDMLSDTFRIFEEAVKFIGLEYTPENIQKALKFSSFSEVQKQEINKGFKEKAPVDELFFRKGKVGTWRDELPDTCSKKIIATHSEMMRKFGYLDYENSLLKF